MNMCISKPKNLRIIHRGNLIDDLLNDEEDWKIHSLKSWTLHPEWSYCTDMINDRYPQEYVKTLLKSMKNGTQSYLMENCKHSEIISIDLKSTLSKATLS